MNSLLIKIKNNFVASFILIAVVVSCGIAAYIYHPASPYHKRYTFVVKYETIGTLSPGNLVRVRGIAKGEIVSVKLTDEAVYVTARVLADAKIPVNSEFRLVTAGLMGEREMSIITGDANKLVCDGDTVSGLYDEGTAGISKNLSAIFSDVDDVRLSVNSFIDSVTDGEIGQRADRVTKKAKKFVRMTKSDIRQWKKQVNELLDDCRAVAARLDSSLQEISNRGGESAAEADKLIERVRGVMDKANSLKVAALDLVKKIDENDGTVGAVKKEASQLNRDFELLKKDFNETITGVKKSGLKINLDIF